jgi:hypothetical protein
MKLAIAPKRGIKKTRETNYGFCGAYYENGTTYLGPDARNIREVVDAIAHETIHHIINRFEGNDISSDFDKLIYYIAFNKSDTKFCRIWYDTLRNGRYYK